MARRWPLAKRPGKHRAVRPHRRARLVVLTAAVGCAATAATLGVVASDARLLRAAVLAGILAAVLPMSLPHVEPRAAAARDWELRRLRLELAALRGEWDAYLAAPASPAAAQPVTSLHLPLIRAALQAPDPSSNGNGHTHTIDLTGLPPELADPATSYS
ncbi:MAG: hypothetical protein ACJ735_16340 [Actinomycetes bacterium]